MAQGKVKPVPRDFDLAIEAPEAARFLEEAATLPGNDWITVAAAILPPAFAERLLRLAEEAQPQHARRRRKLDQRDDAIRDLADQFYADIPTASERAIAISSHLKRQSSMKSKPASPLNAALRKVLDMNEKRPLSNRQIFNILSGIRSPPPMQ